MRIENKGLVDVVKYDPTLNEGKKENMSNYSVVLFSTSERNLIEGWCQSSIKLDLKVVFFFSRYSRRKIEWSSSNDIQRRQGHSIICMTSDEKMNSYPIQTRWNWWSLTNEYNTLTKRFLSFVYNTKIKYASCLCPHEIDRR